MKKKVQSKPKSSTSLKAIKRPAAGRKPKKASKPKPEAKAPIKADLAPQTASYWAERPADDEQRDWTYQTDNWLADYWASREHPHRELILKELAFIPFESLAEVGCNVGPNLDVIHSHFPNVHLRGIDVSSKAIEIAQGNVGSFANVEVGNALRLPWDTQSIDIVLCDAVLMYIPPREIGTAMDEIARVARKAVILVERHTDNPNGEVLGHVYGYNFRALLEARGFTVRDKKITKASWPTSRSWIKYGRFYVGVR